MVNETVQSEDTMVCAAGSLPGDLHKLWRTKKPGGYHMEYGYSCMGYEIAGGLGVKMADPEARSLCAGGGWLLPDDGTGNRHFLAGRLQAEYRPPRQSWFLQYRGLSRSCGNEGMGTTYRYRQGEEYDGDLLPVILCNAASLGAWATRAKTRQELATALAEGRKQPRTSVVVVETSYEQRVPGYESWWDVSIAEVSERESVREARKKYEEARKKERIFF